MAKITLANALNALCSLIVDINLKASNFSTYFHFDINLYEHKQYFSTVMFHEFCQSQLEAAEENYEYCNVTDGTISPDLLRKNTHVYNS